LETLDLRRSQVEDLRPLGKLVQLRNLSVAGTPIAHKDIFHLTSCKNLEELDLSGTKVDFIALRELKTLPKLRRLNLIGCQLSESELQRLADLLPDCEIRSTEIQQ
jgi:Leucine-rich repeat (LRR) protein